METQTYKYRDYEIVVTHTPPFFQAAIYPTDQKLPQIDWQLEPIRSINVKGAEDEAKARINAALADLADAPKASTDRYIVKWSLGSEQRPSEPFSTEQEALSRVTELFVTYGAKLHVEIYLNNSPYLGFRRLSQWRKGMVSLG